MVLLKRPQHQKKNEKIMHCVRRNYDKIDIQNVPIHQELPGMIRLSYKFFYFFLFEFFPCAFKRYNIETQMDQNGQSGKICDTKY